jgi:O-antigen/teichoic acid export membrane protein
MTSYTRLDSVMIERLLDDGTTQAGIYAHGFRILDASSQYALLFASLLLPMFSKMLKNKENISHLVKISFLLLIIPALVIAINLFFFKKDLIYVLYTEHISESAKVFGVLILGFVPIASSYIFGTLLTANGNLKELNIMAGIGVILNLILNFILIPELKAYGAALASLITQLLTAIMQIYIAHKVFGFKLRFKALFSIFTFTLWIVLSAYVSSKYINSRPIALTVTLTIGIISAFAFKLIDLKTLYRIIKYDKS